MPIFVAVEGGSVPVVVEVGRGVAARPIAPASRETLPVTGMGLTLVFVALVAIVLGGAMRVASR
jgi:hypothetical protein